MERRGKCRSADQIPSDRLILRMGKQKFISRIGTDKQLVFEADLTKEYDQEMAKEFEEVARTHPGNIQEFFERLVEVQRRKQERVVQEDLPAKGKNI